MNLLEGDNHKKQAFQSITLAGIVSLFGDITCQGARSVTGPYLVFWKCDYGDAV